MPPSWPPSCTTPWKTPKRRWRRITRLFNPEIGALVDGLTKIKRLDLVSKRAAQGENFRKLLLAIAADVRVLLVKLADRLHNMRTLGFMPIEKRPRIAEETLDIYAPLAGRMGMQGMREELEELAFQHLRPEAWGTISKRLEDVSEKNERLVEEIERILTSLFEAKGLQARVKGRRKRPYSIWKKMESKSVAFEQLSDIFGFRIIVDEIDDCYRALGRRAHDLADGTGALQGLHLHAQAERLSFAPHHRGRPGQAARGVADPHASDARDRRIRYRCARTLQGGGATSRALSAKAAPINGCAARSTSSPRETIRKSFSNTRSWSCSSTRSSASRPRAA